MAFVVRRPEFSALISRIDVDHQRLLETLNALHEAMRRGESQASVRQVLDGLTTHAESHFADEEALMEAARYPGAAAHKAVHAGFLARLEALKARPDVFTDEVFRTVKDWLVGHLLKADLEFAPYVWSSPAKLETLPDAEDT
jgi:hemerythrin